MFGKLFWGAIRLFVVNGLNSFINLYLLDVSKLSRVVPTDLSRRWWWASADISGWKIISKIRDQDLQFSPSNVFLPKRSEDAQPVSFASYHQDDRAFPLGKAADQRRAPNKINDCPGTAWARRSLQARQHGPFFWRRQQDSLQATASSTESIERGLNRPSRYQTGEYLAWLELLP